MNKENKAVFLPPFDLPDDWEDFWGRNKTRLGGSKVRFISNLIRKEMEEVENPFRNTKFKGL